MSNLRIAIITGSTREGRVSLDVAKWVLDNVNEVPNVEYELVDLKDFDLPLLGTSSDTTEVIRWNQTLGRFDGFIFVAAEYNHSLPGVLKNAIDSAKDVWFNKAAGVVSYGSSNGARSAEHLRSVLTELQVANVRQQVMFSLFEDFENGSKFAPRNIHQGNLNELTRQLVAWAGALVPVRAA